MRAETATWRDADQRDSLLRALSTLTRPERALCSRLITRQIRYNANTDREIVKYGPDGVVKLDSARVFLLYEFAFWVPLVLSIVLAPAFTGYVFVLALCPAMCGFVRVAGASVAGRRWREGAGRRA
jgi:hypothetical protein